MIYHARMQGDVQARLVSVGKVEVQRERCGRQCSCCCDRITTSRGEQQKQETRAQTLQTLNTWRLIVVCYHAFRKASACVPHRVLAANACAAHSALASSFYYCFCFHSRSRPLSRPTSAAPPYNRCISNEDVLQLLLHWTFCAGSTRDQ